MGRDGGWADEFLREVCAFPAGHHDDYVDALVHAIVYLRFDSMNNWHRSGRDCAILNVAREHSPAVAATRFEMEVEEVEDLVADYEEAGEELIAEYERARRQLNPDFWCHHCGREIMGIATDNGLHRYHKDCRPRAAADWAADLIFTSSIVGKSPNPAK